MDINTILATTKISRKDLGKSKSTSGNAYRITITRNGVSRWFIFNDNYLNKSTNIDYIKCLELDANAFEECKDVYDFIDCFGYDRDPRLGLLTYIACRKQAERFESLFNKQERDAIRELEY